MHLYTYICMQHFMLKSILYIGNCLRKKNFANFVNLKVFANILLHFSWTYITKEYCPYSCDKMKYHLLPLFVQLFISPCLINTAQTKSSLMQLDI